MTIPRGTPSACRFLSGSVFACFCIYPGSVVFILVITTNPDNLSLRLCVYLPTARFFLHSSVGAGAAPLRVRTQSQPMDPFLIVFFYNDKPIHTSHNDTQRVHLLAPRTNSAVRLGLIDLGCEPALRRCCCFVLLALCEYHHVRDYVAKQNTSELGRNGIADLHEALVLGTMEWIVDGECHQPLRFFFMEVAKPAGCLDEEPAGRGVRECRCDA